MYSNLRNVQIVISLFKQFGIRKIVISPGSRNVAFVHSVEQDDFFECFSIVDERSAAYFALGLAIESNEPVVLTCTSSTATANYLPAIIEAHKNKARIVALTFDRDYRKLYKMEDQMIDQGNMYGEYVVDSTNIQIVKDGMDDWYVTTEINKVLWSSDKKQGPVQINMQIDDFGQFTCKTLPTARKIDICSSEEYLLRLKEYQDILKSKKRIMVYCCQDFENREDIEELLKRFQNIYNSIISYDEFSIAKSDDFIKTCLVTESMHLEEFERLCPDLVITIGGHSWSFMKYKLRHLHNNFIHWHIDEEGLIKDAFNSLTTVFCTKVEFFFKNITQCDNVSDRKYYDLWRNRLSKVDIPELEYSNFYAIQKLSKKIPEGSLVHLSILNSIRLYNFVGGPKSCNVYANLGADGIDGCLSTFIGQSMATDNLSFLIIGDLSSIYDMTAFQYLKGANQRVMIINNHVGSEFYNNFGSYIDTVDNYIGASHGNSLKSACSLSNAKYIKAETKEEFEVGLYEFVSDNDKPIVFEVFTNPNIDTKMLNLYYSKNLYSDYGIKISKVLKRLRLK